MGVENELLMVTANYKIKTVSFLVIGWLLAQPAIAHNGESHGQKQKDSPEELQPSTPNTAEPDPIDSSTYVPEVNAEAEVTTVESVAGADLSASQSASFSLDGYSIGLGEILFGLILIFPWLLITLRKQLNFSTRS